MIIPFTKVHGAGNDFIVVDNRAGLLSGMDIADFVRRVCNRRLAVGADALMLVEMSDRGLPRMRLFNSDGSESPMSGNGGRAFASYVHKKGIVKDSRFVFDTLGGEVEAWAERHVVRLRLSPPRHVRLHVQIAVDGTDYTVHSIDIQGVPHCVLYWGDLDSVSDEEIVKIGRKLRHHPVFEYGANVNFTEVLDEKTLRIRTYERGVEAETLACGSGSTGASVVSFLLGKVTPPVKVKTSSGEWLEVTWPGPDVRSSDLFLTGGVRHTVDGNILPDAYMA